MITKTLKNNKGYMLVELILASMIAFSIAYFAIDITIKVKEKNDDILVATLVNTDQAIITNSIMREINKGFDNFLCTKLTKDNNTVKYNGQVLDVVNEYTTIGNITCKKDDTTKGKKSIKIVIPLTVKQLTKYNYDVIIDYKIPEQGDKTPPTGVLAVSNLGPSVTATVSVTDDDSGAKASYGWKISSSATCNSSVTGFTNTSDNKHTFPNLSAFGKYYVCTRIEDNDGNIGYVSKDVDFQLKLADYVSYTPATKSKVTIGRCSFTPSEANIWRIIRFNNGTPTGTIDIVAHYGAFGCKFLNASDYNSYSDTLNNAAKKFENSTYTVGSRYPADDANGTQLIQSSLKTIKAYGYFINKKQISSGEHLICMEWADGKIHCWSLEQKWYQAYLRPIVTLKSGLKYQSGNGTESSPYVLKN